MCFSVLTAPESSPRPAFSNAIRLNVPGSGVISGVRYIRLCLKRIAQWVRSSISKLHLTVYTQTHIARLVRYDCVDNSWRQPTCVPDPSTNKLSVLSGDVSHRYSLPCPSPTQEHSLQCWHASGRESNHAHAHRQSRMAGRRSAPRGFPAPVCIRFCHSAQSGCCELLLSRMLLPTGSCPSQHEVASIRGDVLHEPRVRHSRMSQGYLGDFSGISWRVLKNIPESRMFRRLVSHNLSFTSQACLLPMSSSHWRHPSSLRSYDLVVDCTDLFYGSNQAALLAVV